MCSPAPCYTCRKTTWTGCGMHADMVMASLAPEDRCTCGQVEAEQPAPAGAAFGL